MASQLLYRGMTFDKVQVAGVGAIVVGVGYAVFLLVGMEVIMLMVAVAMLALYLVARRWISIRERGLISLCSPKMRSILLERSILDIFRDIVYFPYITKIIGAYLRVAATKPHPQDLENALKELPKEVAEASNRKGLLSLAPSSLEQIVLPIQNRELVPQKYGTTDWKWDNIQKYARTEEQVHEETFEKRVVHFLDGKLGWPAAIGLLSMTVIGATHMKPNRFKKMLLQNATFVCMLLALIALLIKARKMMRHRSRKTMPQLNE